MFIFLLHESFALNDFAFIMLAKKSYCHGRRLVSALERRKANLASMRKFLTRESDLISGLTGLKSSAWLEAQKLFKHSRADENLECF
jgi:hypothetical protein